MRVLLILALGALMGAVSSFSVTGAGAPSVSLAFGYLLLTAFFTGSLFASARLPRLTGYIAAGIVVGPMALGLVGPSVLPTLQLFNGAAVALIALSAGTELELRTVRPLFRSIGWITAGARLLGIPAVALTCVLLQDQLPFLRDLPPAQLWSLAAVLGVTMTAMSPAVVFALRSELAADGPVTRTVLAVVVVSDMITLMLFALTSAVARATVGGQADVVDTLFRVTWELFGSLAIGAALGVLLIGFLRRVSSGAAMSVVILAFTIAEVGQRVQLDPLLLSLAAGLVVRNFSDAGERLGRDIERSSLPVYVIFFAVAGAKIDLAVLPLVGAPALLLVLVRAASLYAGGRAGAAVAGTDPAVGRSASMGLLPQAGLAIALAQVFAKTFPELGASAGATILSVVAINEVVWPAFYRRALVKSGEAGRRVHLEAPIVEQASWPPVNTADLPPTSATPAPSRPPSAARRAG